METLSCTPEASASPRATTCSTCSAWPPPTSFLPCGAKHRLQASSGPLPLEAQHTQPPTAALKPWVDGRKLWRREQGHVCWGEGGDTIRQGHSCNASEPEHQAPCFRDPSAGRLLTPTGYSRPATTVGPPFLHPVPRCQALTPPAPASSAPGVPALHPGADPTPPRTLCTNRGAHGLHGGEPGPAAVSHGDEHGTPRPCRPTEPPWPASLSVPGQPQPLRLPSASTAPGTSANASIQSGGHTRRLTRSCAAGAQESCFRGLFCFQRKE